VNIDKVSEGNGVRQCSSLQGCRPMFTAVEDLFVAQAYIKASENLITGKKQKLAVFYVQFATVYAVVKKEQEEEAKHEAEKPSHLWVQQLVALVTYPEWSGSAIYQHFNKKTLPSVIKYMGIVRQVSNVKSVVHAPSR